MHDRERALRLAEVLLDYTEEREQRALTGSAEDGPDAVPRFARDARVRALLPERVDPHLLLVRAAVAAATAALPAWTEAYAQRDPAEAVAVARAWAEFPSKERAAASAEHGFAAGHVARTVWRGPHQRAAWAARTASWAATAPRYGWQAFAALRGACEACGRDVVVEAVAEDVFRQLARDN